MNAVNKDPAPRRASPFIGDTAYLIDNAFALLVQRCTEIDMGDADANRMMRDLAEVLDDCRASYIRPAIREAARPSAEAAFQAEMAAYESEGRFNHLHLSPIVRAA